jgi:membrane DNA delivery protein
MFDKLMGEIVGIASAIVGLALVAVLVGKNAKTGEVLTSAGNALAADIKAAVAPVT